MGTFPSSFGIRDMIVFEKICWEDHCFEKCTGCVYVLDPSAHIEALHFRHSFDTRNSFISFLNFSLLQFLR